MLNEDEKCASTEDDWLKRIHVDQDGYYRPFPDEPVTYGDGGYCNMKFPVLVYNNISLSEGHIVEESRERLLNVFYKMNEERKDFHEYPSPVEDIIDPDLLVCRPPSVPPPPDQPLNPLSDDTDDSRSSSSEEQQPTMPLRLTYQWIPSEFRIFEDGKVRIETPISHLPMTEENSQTYQDLEQVFQTLVPMFGELGLVTSKGGAMTRLQVVVKVQSYNIRPGKFF
ncbi:unnamed protein product [Didymodactylos carnosus]|uniref:DUF4246 domain-containing protein n=1 Tax=Didymodactylos carnosus TaxID=1234261 RepID=A0A815JPH9_9BILA|nr:unnamed protein product [Didymodactylos carnosus]CAF1384135.1 unnamed protein product [Didymodactylos carnosus]CAF4020987.1 unnamed protein product [Didymodactylos carnosus]CAF4279188.1 unnamed protein product [Didymodactylos carnosus]